MKTTALNSSPEYFRRYIELAEDKPFMEILPTGGLDLYLAHFAALEAIGQKVYAPGKWTVNEMVQHIIDNERIFINRALRFLRQDDTDLPGYDHDAYAVITNANNQSLSDLLEEFKAVRRSSELFFKPLSDAELLRSGPANGMQISVLALGYVLIGHPIHHFNVLKERYFGL